MSFIVCRQLKCQQAHNIVSGRPTFVITLDQTKVLHRAIIKGRYVLAHVATGSGHVTSGSSEPELRSSHVYKGDLPAHTTSSGPFHRSPESIVSSSATSTINPNHGG